MRVSAIAYAIIVSILQRMKLSRLVKLIGIVFCFEKKMTYFGSKMYTIKVVHIIRIGRLSHDEKSSSEWIFCVSIGFMLCDRCFPKGRGKEEDLYNYNKNETL